MELNARDALLKKNIPDYYNLYGKDGFASFYKKAYELFTRLEYGVFPESGGLVKAEIVHSEETFCAGKATLNKVNLTVGILNKSFTFPIYSIIPNNAFDKKVPFFVHINFRDNVPDKYLPAEEIIDRGFAVLMFCYKDVTSDDNDFTNGISGLIYQDGVRKNSYDCGKITMWSFAASRVLDYAFTLDSLDWNHAIVIGHSRLGKTALLTGAVDHRFFCAVSNDSGCCGAAIQRGKQGENVKEICKRFPYWFCEEFQKYIGREDELPFDQHLLITMNMPGYVYVASAKEDLWADPENEFLACYAAGVLCEKFGFENAFPYDKVPEVDVSLHNGLIGYHVRNGTHYLSRDDWNRVIDFIKSKIED